MWDGKTKRGINHKVGIPAVFAFACACPWFVSAFRYSYPQPSAAERAMLEAEAKRLYSDSKRLIHPYLASYRAEHLRTIEWRYGKPTGPPEVQAVRLGASRFDFSVNVEVPREKGKTEETLAFSPFRGLNYWSGPTTWSKP